MPIQLGNHLGPYEILAAIGAGGMGEVYRARDSKLGRDVAIKVLPDEFARDAERMARFQREAKFLASLNHPNIASIYGLEDSGSTRALVMELVEGPTLADRIRRGPIPIDEALPIARQICEALEYAHERGIVHRDLKPGNVKVTRDDTVKILDFGLAKAVEGEAALTERAHVSGLLRRMENLLEGDTASTKIASSPALSDIVTRPGILLGTVAYMSPEQAKGKPVDRRADIWAFGCVLYEMLTGKMAFRGESTTDTLAAVIRAEPDWSQLPTATPPHVQVLLRRCLQKDVRQRLQAIGDARISVEEVLSSAPEPTAAALPLRPAKQWRLWLVSGIAGLFVLATILLAFLYFHEKPPTGEVTRFEIPMPEKVAVADFAISPDGRKLAFIGLGSDAQPRVWLRSLETLEARPLEGTEGADGWPFWSQDSRFIAFPTSSNKLKKIEISGGTPVTLCDAASYQGGTWNRNDEIVFGSNAGLLRVPASGGVPSPVTTGGIAVSPSFLPDGRHFVYWRALGPGVSSSGIYFGSLDTKPEEQPSKELVAGHSIVYYTPSPEPSVGYLLFVRGPEAPGSLGTLMAQPFDTRRLELTDRAVPIAEQVSNVNFSTSATGVLVYIPGGGLGAAATGSIQGRLAWFDREGKILGTFGDPGSYRSLALSPDGKRVAFERGDPKNPGGANIWLYEFARDVTTRFTFESDWDSSPVWSPDGSRIAFGSSRGGVFDLYQKTSNLAGEDELLFKSGDYKIPSSWSPDGRFLLYFNPFPPTHLWLLPRSVEGAERKPIQVGRSEFNEGVGRFSPNGRWIAYESDESGRDEIYVRPFDTSSATGTSATKGAAVTGKWMSMHFGAMTARSFSI
jgi:serine/threonine protein kinase